MLFNEKNRVKSNNKCNFNLVKWMSKNIIISYACVFLFYFIFAALSNWSLLLGENHMKWDIWVAEYPNQVLMSDALAGGTVPLWNPLIQYGTPYYAMLGCPVWYPITFFLAMIGYTPVVLAFSYLMHIAIGGFGMFLLGQQALKKSEAVLQANTLIASIIVGLIYCGSGLFLSNAEHIMIFASAAWLPYIFFFMRKYLENHCIIYAMLSGASAGMIILGGYPELFYDTFLFLAPYTLYFCFDQSRRVLKNILTALEKYIVVCIFTICSGAISLIPFLNVMGLLTRTNGLGQVVGTYSMNSLLSLVFPGTATFANTGEVSMVNYYVSILVVLLIPAILSLKQKDKIFYGGMVILAYILCIGDSSFVHSILYRFFPMYSSFRFPTVNRCVLAMFLLLIVVYVIKDILEYEDVTSGLKVCKYLFVCVLVLAVSSGLIGSMANELAFFDSNCVLSFSKSAYLAAIVIVGYGILFYFIHTKQIKGTMERVLVLGVVAFDLLTFHHVEMPITIAAYDDFAYSNNIDVRDLVDNEFTRNRNRNRSVDFSESRRTVNGLDSQTIVFNKTLSEDGYLSILLDNVQSYKKTFLRSIMEQNPEAYFTNDIVTADDVDYYTWTNSGSTPPEQIYVDGETVDANDKIRLQPQEVSSIPLTMTIESGNILLQGPITTGDLKTGRIRIYYDTYLPEAQTLNIVFTDNIGNSTQYVGEYLMRQSSGENYIDVYLPNIDTVYNSINMVVGDMIPIAVSLVNTERMLNDKYVDITSFGFNEVVMDVTAPAEGYVTLLQAKYDGWKAYVDGEETEITLVDNCFMGVKVSEGNHRIVMKFRPWDFYVGLFVSCCFFAVLIVKISICIIHHKGKRICEGKVL